MSKIPRQFINDLLARSDLVAIIDARVPLKKRGHNYLACCPFHDEKSPSFTVSPVKQFYHCFGCGVSGNAVGFLMEYERLSFVEAIEQLAQQAGIDVPYEEGRTASHATSNQNLDYYQLLENVAQYYQLQLRNHPHAVNYLKNRGLNGLMAKNFLLGYAPDQWDCIVKKFGTDKNTLKQLSDCGLITQKNGKYYDRFRDRVIFPIRDRRGRMIGFGGRILEKGEPKYLNSPETPVFHKGRELYGLYEAQQADRDLKQLIIVEGYMDVIALAQYEINNVVATLGTATTADHIQQLFRITQEIIFCFDGDKAGQTAAWRALETTLPLLQDGWQIRFLLLPANDDPDSLVRREGKEGFVIQVDKAIPLADFLFAQLSKQNNLSTLEGKAKFAKQAMALIKKIPAEILPQLLLDRLAQLVHMDITNLQNIAQIKPQQKSQQPLSQTVHAKPQEKTKRSRMRTVIALLIQYPQLVLSLQDMEFIEKLTLPGSDLLREIIRILQDNPQVNTGTLIEYWRDLPEKSVLTQLAVLDLTLGETEPEQMLLSILNLLKEDARQQRLDHLVQKKQLTGLTKEETAQLHQLLAGQN